MDIHNTESLKKAKSTKPENHPATINVSDPCIDVCYLLCVDIKTPFWEDPFWKKNGFKWNLFSENSFNKKIALRKRLFAKSLLLKSHPFKNFTS